MKKIVVFLLAAAILFSACSGRHKVRVGEPISSIHKQYTPYLTINPLSAYEIGGNYWMTIDDGDTVQKLAEFSPDRTCLRTQGLRLIEINGIDQLLNVSLDSLTEKLGQPHADIGSGFSVPAYITDDAELLCFELENDSVVEIILRDLFTGEIVDRVAG